MVPFKSRMDIMNGRVCLHLNELRVKALTMIQLVEEVFSTYRVYEFLLEVL